MAGNSPSPVHQAAPAADDDIHAPRLNEISQKFIADCVNEKERLDEHFPIASMLFDDAIDKVYSTGRIPGREMHADVFKQKLIKISQKVFIPVKQFPKFNFQGKILGPRGNSLRNLQKETLCRILIKGRNSMRDAQKEEELRQSGDPRNAHLNKDLYVEISTVATPAEAYARLAYALAEIRKYLIPDSNDEVSQSQRREILADPELAKKARKTFNDSGESDQAALSILKKISFSNGGDNDQGRPSSAQKPPMKRPPPESSPYFKRKSAEYERSPAQGPQPTQSILKKMTEYNHGYHHPEEEYERKEYGYEEEDESVRNHSFKPTPQPTPSYMTRRYETPQKRSREAPNEYQVSQQRYGASKNY